ncbi:MAG: hypothetical protein WCP85_29105 [Mariniphaga sp.]
MKTKIIFGLLLALFCQLSSYGQYELYDLQFQMNMQNAYSKIETKHSYTCFDGKTIICFFTLARMNGFEEVSARIQDSGRTKRMSMSLNVDKSNPMVVMVIAGDDDWELSYGDRITIRYGESLTKTLVIGVEDGFSEPDWNDYKEYLIAESRRQTQNTTISYESNQQNINITSGTQRQCGYCNGTGKCPYCNSAGQSKACVENQLGVRCSDSYCIAHNHKCKHCEGTHICSRCKGNGYK